MFVRNCDLHLVIYVMLYVIYWTGISVYVSTGGPGQQPHLAPTYAAVCALCIIGTPQAYESIDRFGLLQFSILIFLISDYLSVLIRRSSDDEFLYFEASETVANRMLILTYRNKYLHNLCVLLAISIFSNIAFPIKCTVCILLFIPLSNFSWQVWFIF